MNFEREIHKILMKIGISPKLLGYMYIVDAIKIAYEDPMSLMMITKVIYPTIAKRYGTASSNVERNIRNAIECGWTHGDIDIINGMFNHIEKDRPSNSQFISTLVGYMWVKVQMV